MRSAARSAIRAEFRARVVAGFGRRSLVQDERGHIWEATRRGKKGDVVVGDQVLVIESGGQVSIEAIEPRTTLLFRADAFRSKALASDVDLAIIVFASRPQANRWFIWKALVAASAAGIEALVLRNKCDLEEGAAEADSTLRQIAELGWRTLAVSAKAQPETTRSALMRMISGRNSLFVGQSGMGKSTLLNLLVLDARARTQEYSERLNLGRQTTTATRWFPLPEGGAVVDTPGFREFGLAHLGPTEIAATFPEFRPLLGKCRFLDCRHLSEPGCAIRGALEAGRIAADRYEFFCSLTSETVR
jgi:ribosome biogenesis GTPase / thiamine phosphate phosphatase